MRTNLTKKDIKFIYMQIGFSKNILNIILEDLLMIIVNNLKRIKN